jgi:hypothetical protein
MFDLASSGFMKCSCQGKSFRRVHTDDFYKVTGPAGTTTCCSETQVGICSAGLQGYRDAAAGPNPSRFAFGMTGRGAFITSVSSMKTIGASHKWMTSAENKIVVKSISTPAKNLLENLLCTGCGGVLFLK